MVALLAALLAFLPAGAASAAPAAAAPSPCDQLDAQANALIAQIEAHNAAQATVPITNAAAVAVYNAEADALEAQQDALLARAQSCSALETQATELLRSSPGDYQYVPTETNVSNVAAAAAAAALNPATPARPPAANGTYSVPPELRPYVRVVRQNGYRADRMTDESLQGQARPSVGDVDPAYPGATIAANSDGGARVEVDHIVPVAEIVNLPGFWQLSSYNQLQIMNASVNLQWLSRAANRAKSSGSFADIAGTAPDFAEEQAGLADTARAQLTEAIQVLVQQQQQVTG